jgi:hypothetical protein
MSQNMGLSVEESEDANTVSAVIKSESLKGELDTIHKDGRTIVLSVDAVKPIENRRLCKRYNRK